jgi:hypothetical protein
MRRGWKIAVGLAGAVILTPVVLLSPPAGELLIRLTCRMEPLTPRCVVRMRAMGHVWARFGWLDRAIMWYGRAATEGDDTAAYFHLGWAYEQRGYRQIVPRVQAHEKVLGAAAAKMQAELKAQADAGVTDMADLKMPAMPAVPEPKLRDDFKRAEDAYHKAADCGFAPAMNNLGNLYESSLLGHRNANEAFRLYMAAARAGNPVGAFNVSRAYHEGLGTARNLSEARKWAEWSPAHFNRADLAEPTLQRTQFFGSDLSAPLRAKLRAVAENGPPAFAKLELSPLKPDPSLPPFSQVRERLKGNQR